MLQTTERRNRDRVKITRKPPIHIVSASVALTVLTVTFDQPIGLKGVPAYETGVLGASAVSAGQTGPMTIEVTYSVSIALASTLTIPYQEISVRNSKGGFVADSVFILG